MGILKDLLSMRRSKKQIQVLIDQDMLGIRQLDINDTKSAYADELCNHGNTYLKISHYAEAIEIYKKALQINPEHYIVWCNIGVAYSKSNHTVKGIEALIKSTQINPQYANAWYNLGDAYFRSSQRDKAAEAFQQAIYVDPNHAIAKQYLSLCR